MARIAAVLSPLAFVVLGSGVVGGVVGDDPTVLIALLGTALCALGYAQAARTVVRVARTVAAPGRPVGRTAGSASRRHHPDAAGRPRPRAPGALRTA